MKPLSVRIDRRFSGPPNSGNGGYSCGLIAQALEGCAEVTLRTPPPLDTDMMLHRLSPTRAELRHDELLIGEAQAVEFQPVDLVAPAFSDAEAAATRTFAVAGHPLPGCFVCGPNRSPEDGLRIHPGPLDANDEDWAGTLAAPWTPAADLGDDTGRVRDEFIWAALDCPTAYAVSSSRGMRLILLGRQSVRVLQAPQTGDRCVIAARRTGADGRKYHAVAALFSESGTRLADCRATWIEVSREVLTGLYT